ncbi:MAG: hypothetical protein AAF990_26735 [Bacteroidota bacterium]
MKQLKDILLSEDRASLDELRQLMDDPVALSEKVSPIIEQRLTFFKQHFPKEFKLAVDKIVDRKLKDSQEEILNVIYPVLGKMIRKFIAHQFQLLKDNIDFKIKNALSAKGFWGRIKASLFGVEESDIILSSMHGYVIEEVYVVQRDSGLLMGSASLKEVVDREVIAGMLTAIKAFVEDAFKRERQDLEMIQYGNYNIFIQNIHSYYIAIAFSGSISTSEKDELSSMMMDFAQHELSDHQVLDENNFKFISEKLKNYFITPAARIEQQN